MVFCHFQHIWENWITDDMYLHLSSYLIDGQYLEVYSAATWGFHHLVEHLLTEEYLKSCNHPTALMETSDFDEGKHFDGPGLLKSDYSIDSLDSFICSFLFSNHQHVDWHHCYPWSPSRLPLVEVTTPYSFQIIKVLLVFPTLWPSNLT